MSKFVRPNVFISSCIEFEACRYDGTHISDDFVKRLKEVVKVTRVCPEMMIGLGTPRDSLRLVQSDDDVKLLQSSNGEDLTSKMTSFTLNYIDKLKEKEISTVFHYIPLHTSSMGERYGYKFGDLPKTEDLSGRLLRLPMYCELTEGEIEYIVSNISEVMC